jgi:hypothetical protein
VTDERAYQTMTPIDNLILGGAHSVSAAPIEPRTIGLQLGFNF